MIRLFVLGSGSKGNAFAVETAGGVLLVDAGFGPKALQRRAERVGLDLGRTVAMIVTHEHGDHAESGVALARRMKVPLLCSNGTWSALGAPAAISFIPLRHARPLVIGSFTVHCSLTTHDAREPLAVAVETAGGVRLAFATDIGRSSSSVRYLMQRAHAIVVESNYDELMLRTGRYPPSVQQRIAGSNGHLSNRAAADLVASVMHQGLSVVVLAHLSQQCNDPGQARQTVEPLLRARGFAGRVLVALQDEPLPAIPVARSAPPAQVELALGWGPADRT
ncbi:MAG TPA: MBL fold metallo-hydrolase [Gemmatimonadales bacterium]